MAPKRAYRLQVRDSPPYLIVPPSRATQKGDTTWPCAHASFAERHSGRSARVTVAWNARGGRHVKTLWVPNSGRQTWRCVCCTRVL